MKLALGTVQFGSNYGVMNTSKRMSDDELAEILNRAFQSGIRTLDTAILYGDSEERLGRVGVSKWDIVTKLPSLKKIESSKIEGEIKKGIEESLERLQKDELDAVLLHDASDLKSDNSDEIISGLLELKTSGLARKIGISIYSPNYLDEIAVLEEIDIVQVPYNIFDRRLSNSGWLRKLEKSNIEVHTRSAFLQGLLLFPMHQLPEKFNRWSEHFSKWDEWIDGRSSSRLAYCLSVGLKEKAISRVIVGIDSMKHLKSIINAVNENTSSVPKSFAIDDPLLIHPSNWEKL